MKNKTKLIAGISISLICTVVGAVTLKNRGEELILYSKDSEAQNQSVIEDEVCPDNVSEGGTSVPDEAKIPENVTVYVCGRVKTPGVYTLPKDSRAVDAVSAAGGFDENAAREYLNLADFVTDGMKLYVPSTDEVEPGALFSATSELTDEVNGLVNINTATRDELMTLPGIGESKAESIIKYRESFGLFKTAEDIMNIAGIKEKMFEKIRDFITV